MNKGQAVFRTYTTLGRCLAALPEPVALGVANVVGDVLFEVRGDQRRMVSANLRRVLGADAGRPTPLLDRWARRSFRAYARYWVEGARLRTHVADRGGAADLRPGPRASGGGDGRRKGRHHGTAARRELGVRGRISGHAGPADDLGGRAASSRPSCSSSSSSSGRPWA